MKTAARIKNIISEIRSDKIISTPTILNDNKATIDFVKGNSVVKGCRHMELRMQYTQQEYQKGAAELDYMEGNKLPSDKLTKLGCVAEHRIFARSIQGLDLLGYEYFKK